MVPNYAEPQHEESDGNKPECPATMPALKENITDSDIRKWRKLFGWAKKSFGWATFSPKKLTPVVGFYENKECWVADDFSIRMSGNILIVEILLSSLHKLTQTLPTACHSLRLGAHLIMREKERIRLRVQDSMWKNTIRVAGQSALPADLLLRDKGIGIKADGQKDGT